jgi:hypothetical protein
VAGVSSTSKPNVRCSSTGYSSARYGDCEICKKHVPEVWIGTHDNGYTHVFGHEDCVRGAIERKRCVAELASGHRCGMEGGHAGTHYALIDGKTARWPQVAP